MRSIYYQNSSETKTSTSSLLTGKTELMIMKITIKSRQSVSQNEKKITNPAITGVKVLVIVYQVVYNLI